MYNKPLAERIGFRRHSVIPGFGLSFGVTVTWLTLIILIPLAGLVLNSASLGIDGYMQLLTDERTRNALRISFGCAFIAAVVNVIFGVPVAWVLVRYNFPGKRVVDAIVDLPFALPTAVAGISLAALYAKNGWIGGSINSVLAFFHLPGIKIAFSPIGIVVALTFIGLPFVVRTVQPVIEEIDKEVEEAAATLGATRLQAIRLVILPSLTPAILTGFALAFARAAGEYGSVIFIAGNIPYVSEIAPLLIIIRLEEFNYAGATAIATVMLAVSFLMLFVINLIQAWTRRYANVG
jgi:sulfate/thiosulfate transport system permease protein